MTDRSLLVAADAAATQRGAAMMTLAMACFAFEDALIKGLSRDFAPAQIVWMLGLGGATAFALWLALSGRGIRSPFYRERTVLMRSGFEAVGSCCFVTSLALVPLSLASAVIQATPLVVAMGAALFLGATVGWRRWAAIAAGFLGVLLILRPGGAGFDPAMLLVVAGMLCLSARDLSTRVMPAAMSGAALSLHAFATLVPAGLLLQMALGAPFVVPHGEQLAVLGLCVVIGMAGYLTIVAATRGGDIAVISSFRYSRMLFALLIGALAFGERPGAATLVGVAIVIASGLYTLIRESRLRRAG